ncbi:TetR/AcrR family transcriptional regulator [Lysinibacillus sp. NPDC093216]|uniref:TetR/AcrR family transcriptional regulator n=1 Tax=Lysinibacillus sp. NPDC093216 TaxID=3390576 RepID=UPI003D049CA1
MARNKYPEQTLEQILTVSTVLFKEKGYEKTSIQDIIDKLGMSKGAIYHHFRSKEEILLAVMEKQFSYATQMFDNLINNTQAANSKEKLTKILEHMVADPKAHSIDSILITQIKNPQFVVTGIKNGVNKDAPSIAKIMLEGKEDGSINTDFPTECAEIFMLLVNIWINPILFEREHDDTVNRLRFLQQMMKGLGADIVSDQLINKLSEHYSDIGGYIQNE